jgi:hypothetical protein
MKLTFFDINDEPSIKMRKNPKTLTLFDDIESRSLFTKGINDSPENDLNNKIYINTESNLINVRNEESKKREKKFNMNNYEEIFKKNREKNLFTKNEEINAEIIKNILDAMKIRKTKKENYINRTILSNISKNNSKKTKIDYTLTNPNALRIISDKIYKNKRRDKINDLSYEKDKIINKTIIPRLTANPIYNERNKVKDSQKHSDIKSIRKGIINLDKKINNLNHNIKRINLKINGSNKVKFRKNINFINNKKSMDNYDFYSDENNKNFIKNRKYFNHYIQNFINLKYNNELINKFFENKEKDFENRAKTILKIERKYENEDEYYYLHKKPKILPISVLNKINMIKKRFKSNSDKEVFNLFNKKI